ncbi:hypothetical protein [Acetatifactor muris]|uniref:hypothetical protein n=1 Tax=Acetatifactor muris TaxID=879566 RepID=UPI0023F35258|nr:hypothetical protein [Acetatifactor muris]
MNISREMTGSEDDRNLAWEEMHTEHIVQDEWIDFRRSSYRFPDGSPAGCTHHGLAAGKAAGNRRT